jgi:N-acylglucosamine 2-epimerase
MLEDFGRRYRDELLNSVIPFWMRHSLDREHGGYFTCLDREGAVYDTRKYVWMQGRQVWTLSRLYNTVERRPEWLAAARSGLEFLRRNALDAQGRVYFSLTREGLPAGCQRKPYAAFFLVLALSEYYRATGDEACLTEAIALYERVQEWIARPALLDRPAPGGGRPMRQLADLMVIGSMSLELNAARPDAGYLETMRRMTAAVFEHYDAGHQVLLENIAPDGSSLRDTPEGRQVCPGDALEVAWFVLHMLEATGAAESSPEFVKTLQVIEGSLEFGWDGEYGGLYYFMDIDRRPPLMLEWNMKLWWSHTEALYALVLAYLKTGDQKWQRWLERVDEYTFRVFADPKFGEWFGYCDRRGEVVLNSKGGSYKGCFHVPRFLMLASQRIEEFNQRRP